MCDWSICTILRIACVKSFGSRHEDSLLRKLREMWNWWKSPLFSNRNVHYRSSQDTLSSVCNMAFHSIDSYDSVTPQHTTSLTTLRLCSQKLLDNLTFEGQFHTSPIMEKISIKWNFISSLIKTSACDRRPLCTNSDELIKSWWTN